MKEITEIKKIGKGDRYYLYLDNEFFGVSEAEILAKYAVKTGKSYDDEFLEELKLANGDYACFNRGLAVLEKSMKTEKMLKDYLKEKGYPIVCIESAIEKIKEYGYINDELFCENYISSYMGSKSKKKLKYDLRAKGVKEDIIDEKLQYLIDDDSEYTNCLNIANKFLKNKEINIKTKQKFYNHLAGKGFDYGLISRAWEEISVGRD